MSSLDSSAILLEGVRAALRPAMQVGRGSPVLAPSAAFRAPRATVPAEHAPAAAPRVSSSFQGLYSPQATIRQAEMLIQLTATAAPSPALRRIVAAAYQMEIDARRELARIRIEGSTPRREWFA